MLNIPTVRAEFSEKRDRGDDAMAKIKQFLGIMVLILCGLGLVLSVVAGYGLIRFRKPAIHRAENALESAGDALAAAERGLAAAAGSLGPSLEMMATVQEAVREIAFSLEETEPLFDSMADVLGDELPVVISSTQDSLEAAQETAVVVDRVLYALDAISFLSGVTYDPEVPLAESVENVSASLDDLEPTFLVLEDGIEQADTNTAAVGAQLEALEENLAEMEEPLREAEDSLEEYREMTRDLQEQLEDMSGQLARWINRLAAGLGLILLWQMIIQAALFLYGWELVFGFRSD
jgi:methyl-accepting chemotaxis protein